MAKYYYAVKEGKMPGVYETWSECERQVKGYSGAIYKKFPTYNEAFNFTNPNEVKTIRDNCIEKNEDTTNNKDEDNKEKITSIIRKNASKNNIESPKDKPVDEKHLRENEALAYVDGSFDLSTFTYSYGVVFITTVGKETYSGRANEKILAEMRNVSGEIKGAMVAMEIALKENKDTLYLHFDYTGIRDWAEGNWKTNKEGTKSYKKFYDSIKDKLDVKFIKVKAHSGVEYNEEADKLAKEAILGVD